jgi:hypothetical protein
MATNKPQYVSKPSQENLRQFHISANQIMNRQWNFREQMRQIDLAFMREQDWTEEQWRARLSNRAGNADKIQNITVPIIKPQVLAAVAYQAGTFLTDYPLFGVTADPTFIDQAMQMQAVIEENSVRGGWTRELLLFFLDGFKYNLSAIEVDWKKITTYALETDVGYKGGKEGKPVEVVWEGNSLKRWDMYNTYFDTRCIPYEIPTKGEFAGTTELYTRTALKTLINSLPTKLTQNIVPAFESPCLLGTGSTGVGVEAYFTPQINPEAIVDYSPQDAVDWMSWSGLVAGRSSLPGGSYHNLYEVSTEYVRIMPSDFDIQAPAPNTPQVWKLIWVNHTVLIYAERQTNAHERIPVFFGQPSEDGLGYQTKSLATDGLPFQQVSSALMNGVLAARRRAVGDRVLYDPSRVSQNHIENPSPTAKIPVRPAAFGKPVGESVYAFPFRDDQSGTSMQEIQSLFGFANVLNGQNAARQGQFVKGNKTDGQWESTMANGTSQDQMCALKYEAQVFTPLKEVLKLNMLQYQGPVSIYSPSQERNITIDPIALRQAVINFKVTDGMLSSDKVISKDSLKVAMQVIGSSPQLAGEYNLGPMFSYITKTENINLRPFEKTPQQKAYESAQAQWSQMAQLSIQKGVPFNIPQPLPEQFGFDPATMNPASAVPQQSPQTVPAEQIAASGIGA